MTTTFEVVAVPVDRLRPSDHNLRADVGDVTELAASIATVGILNPLTVTTVPDTDPTEYRILAGERRYTAARLAGLTEVPCLVRSPDHHYTDFLVMLVENLQRQDLDPIEEATGYQSLLNAGFRQKHIVERVGRSKSHVSKRLKLLTLPDRARAAVADGTLSLEDALELTRLVDHPTVVDELLEDGFHDAKRVVDSALARIASNLAVAALIDRMTGLGYQPAEMSINQWGQESPPKGSKQVGDWYDCVDVDENAHKQEPCARFHVKSRYGVKAEAVWYCIRPVRHNPDGASDLKAAKPSSRGSSVRERALRKRQREQQKRRRTVAAEILASRPARKQVLDLVLEEYLTNKVSSDEARIVCGFLELDPPKNSWGTGYDYRQAVTDFAATDPVKAALAVTMAGAELSIEHGYTDKAAAYLERLRTAGYIEDPTS